MRQGGPAKKSVSAKGRLRMEMARCHKAGQQKIGFGQGSFEDGAGLKPQGGPAKNRFRPRAGLMPQGGPAKKSVSAKGRLRMELG